MILIKDILNFKFPNKNHSKIFLDLFYLKLIEYKNSLKSNYFQYYVQNDL